MTGFLISAVIMFVLILIIWLGVRTLEGDRLAAIGVCFIIFLILGLVINSAIESEAIGPCHKYETRMMYNTATKTMMPSRVCVLRGEWVEESYDNQ